MTFLFNFSCIYHHVNLFIFHLGFCELRSSVALLPIRMIYVFSLDFSALTSFLWKKLQVPGERNHFLFFFQGYQYFTELLGQLWPEEGKHGVSPSSASAGRRNSFQPTWRVIKREQRKAPESKRSMERG